MVVCDVYGAKVPVFIVEEVENIEEMEEADKEHRLCHVSERLVLIRHPR
jgi:hypothetical protein